MWIDDLVLKEADKNLALLSYTPKDTFVVLGSNNKAETEVALLNCESDGIAVLRRLGGGGTVLLYPGSVVVSVGAWVFDYYNNSLYFELLNNAVIACLARLYPKLLSLHQAGISDIAYDGKKIAGTSLFRSRNYLLYQCSILVQKNVAGIERYLKHPTKEPDYRAGRPHSDFLAFLGDLVQANPTELANHLSSHLEADLLQYLGDRLCLAKSEQLSYLQKKTELSSGVHLSGV